jgi:hypothetical protein
LRNEAISGEVLRAIYLDALDRCRPSLLVSRLLRDRPDLAARFSGAAAVIALGKCAPELLRGAAEALPIGRCFAALPAGYERPMVVDAEVHFGSHPELTEGELRGRPGAASVCQRVPRRCTGAYLRGLLGLRRSASGAFPSSRPDAGQPAHHSRRMGD